MHTNLVRRVMSAHYPPASTYKMLPLLAALESGKFTTDHQVTCQGFYDVGENEEGEYRRRFRCWQRQGHGTLSMSDALKESCDVYLYDLVAGEQGLGHEETIAVARRFGLGEQLCMDLIGETPGTVPDETYKLQKYGDGWRTGDSINHSIGQGFWETTPLQLATMISRLVNGGYAVQPYYVQPNVPYVWPQIDIAAENLTHIRAAMESVTLDRNGTAYKARIKVAGMEMAGKTGTAQVKSLEVVQKSQRTVLFKTIPTANIAYFWGTHRWISRDTLVPSLLSMVVVDLRPPRLLRAISSLWLNPVVQR